VTWEIKGRNNGARRNCPLRVVNINVSGIRQGEAEARHRKYKRLELGGGQAYDPSADQLHFQSN
jgi:hypothetical protein